MTAKLRRDDVVRVKDAVGPIAPRHRARAAGALLALAFIAFLVGYAIFGPVALRLIEP
jgi:hypothetical protein